jgi:5-oxoprolinase (ATP-hydrolysing)
MPAPISFTGTSAEHITNSRLTDPEILESRYPVLIDAFRVRRGSGDRGRWSGGDGVVRRIRFRESMVVAVLANSPVIAPFGREGGNPGIVGKTYIQRADRETENLGSCGQREVRPSDAIVIETPGGGGFGARQ